MIPVALNSVLLSKFGGFRNNMYIYAEQFISGRLVYQRFSPREQYGCSAGGEANVIASLLAGAENIPRSVRLIGDFVFGPGGGKIIIRDE